MSAFVVIILCLFAGILLRRFRVFGGESGYALNRFVIYISLPAMVLKQIHDLPLSEVIGPKMLAAAGMPWGLLVVSLFVFWVLGKIFGWPRSLVGCLALTAGLGNTSFVGFPLLEALRGSEALKTGIVVDQVGSFFALSVLGTFAAAVFSGEKPTLHGSLKRILLFPPMIAFLLALATRPWVYPAFVEGALDRLSATLVPLALVSVGSLLRWDAEGLKRYAKILPLGLFFKLAFAPALVMLALRSLWPPKELWSDVVILEAAMATMITGAMVAIESDLEPDLAALMVSVSIPISLVTVPLWNLLLR